MQDHIKVIILGTILILFGLGASYLANKSIPDTEPDTGPLKVNPLNPRYFTDGTGKSIYLTGSHTWSNFKDTGKTDPPQPFNFTRYLDFLQEYNHNFIRLWTLELSTFEYDDFEYAEPFPWRHTGPGTTFDGKPKFDLTQFNQSYFDRLRSRVEEAGQRGIYVSIMLFNGYGLQHSLEPWCWDGHLFNTRNNINGINGDPDGDGRGLETHTLAIPAITGLQEAYVRKIIDTVNDMDNVLYEISNESGKYSTEWQYHIINYIHEYEKGMPKQHPVGMTFQYSRVQEHYGTNEDLVKSPADWISPGPQGGYQNNPPVADGSKVIIADTDHLFGVGGDQAWVWKSFCRGLNPIFMDPYLFETPNLDSRWDPIRRNMGYTLTYANKMNLTAMVPFNDIASSKYCLANPGIEYLIYLPDGGNVMVDLSETSEELVVEWFNPNTGNKISGETITGGNSREFTAPFKGDAVLYIIVNLGS